MSKQELVVVLGGALRKTPGGKWRTTTFWEGDNFGISGDCLRMVAAYKLYKNDPKRLFLVSGGKGQYKKIAGVPAVSEVLKKELVKFRIPARQIRVEKKSGNTLEQLLALQDIIKEKGIFKVITIISNRYHLPRIKAFISYYSDLREINKLYKTGYLKLLAAEKILLRADQRKWEKVIERAYASPAMKDRLILERQGIKQIKNGTYNFRVGDKELYE